MTQISIIIPCYHDHEALLDCLASLQLTDQDEIIVVDASPLPAPQSQFAAFPQVQWQQCAPNRSAQLNQGAKAATGDFLLFLHADSVLPPLWRESILAPLSDPDVRLTAFRFTTDSSALAFRLLDRFVWLRCALFQRPYGDQGFCLSTSSFESIGGFPEQELMEDYEFITQIKKIGKITTVEEALITSARRWSKFGIIRTTFLNQWVTLLYRLHVSPVKLGQLYRQGKFILPVDNTARKK